MLDAADLALALVGCTTVDEAVRSYEKTRADGRTRPTRPSPADPDADVAGKASWVARVLRPRDREAWGRDRLESWL